MPFSHISLIRYRYRFACAIHDGLDGYGVGLLIRVPPAITAEKNAQQPGESGVAGAGAAGEHCADAPAIISMLIDTQPRMVFHLGSSCNCLVVKSKPI